MHIPDGLLDAKTAAATVALSAAGLGVALRQVRRVLPRRKVPLLGLSAAFVFAAQMVNFPVAGGTSGHLLGGVLVAALLGPAAAVVVLATVLFVQCFLFGDGGVSALGANVLNMALVGSVGGWAVFRGVSRWLSGLRGQVAAVAFAGWCSTVLAALGCAGQLAASGTVDGAVAFPAMTAVHMLIGLGEGLITGLVFLAIVRARPELAPAAGPTYDSGSPAGLVGLGLVASLGLALFVAPFACPWPDGLETVAAKLGFEARARGPLLPVPIPDYEMPGIGRPAAAVAAAGAVGTLLAFGLALVLSRFVVREQDRAAAAPVGIRPPAPPATCSGLQGQTGSGSTCDRPTAGAVRPDGDCAVRAGAGLNRGWPPSGTA